MKIILLLIFVSPVFLTSAQQADYKVDSIEGNTSYISSIELSPDQKTLAIATGANQLYFWDVASEKISHKIELNGYAWGPYLEYSKDGKFLLLQQQFFTNFRINKDRPSRVEVMDVKSGKVLMTQENVHFAQLVSDGKTIAILRDETIIFLDIESGREERKFRPENITNAFAVSPDGNTIAVSQKATGKELLNIPSVRNDKKTMKEAEKFREVTVFYDAHTFEKKFVADDVFDIVFSMKYSSDGSTLYLFNAPNRKFRTSATGSGASRNGYIQATNAADGKVSRIIYSTNASEPIYKESHDRKYFASASVEQKFYVINSVMIFNRESGETIKNFQNDFRLTENLHFGRACFEFLPGDNTLVMGYGKFLAFWNLEK